MKGYDNTEENTSLEGGHSIEQRLKKLVGALRVIGATLLLSAAVVFLAQGWARMEQLAHYYTFLAFTVVIAGVGYLCGTKLKDANAARALFGVSAAVMPAHYATLGAFVYAYFYGVHRTLPKLLQFHSLTGVNTLLAVLIATICLIPVVFLGFSLMARPARGVLTIVYMLFAAALLIPSRNPYFVIATTSAMMAIIYMLRSAVFANNAALQTTEAQMAKGLLVIPVIILLGRGFLYDLSAILACFTFEVLGIFSLRLSGKVSRDYLVRMIQLLGNFLILTGGLIFVDACQHSLGLIDYRWPVAVISWALITSIVSVDLPNSRHQRLIASWGTMLTVLGQLFFAGDIISSIICIVSAVVIIAIAVMMQEKGLLQSGILGLVFGILYHLRYAVDLFGSYPWISLGVFGILIVLASTRIEYWYQKSKEIRTRLAEWK